jgi:hypothetical protein
MTTNRCSLFVLLLALALPQPVLAQVCPPAHSTPEPVSGAGQVEGVQAVDGQADVVIGDGLVVEFPRSGSAHDLQVSIEWFKSSGSCAAPTTAGEERFSEVGFTLRRPDGQLLSLVQPGDWTGIEATNANNIETVFEDSGVSPSSTSLPSGVDYSAAGGLMDPMLENIATGTWDLLATDAAAGAELCVYGWTLQFASGAGFASWGGDPPALPPQGDGTWGGQQTVDGVEAAVVGDGLVVFGLNDRSPSDLVVTITWTKTDGGCSAQTAGPAYHEELGFSLRRPDGLTRQLVVPGTYSGNDDIGTVVTSFDDAALTPPLGGRPISGSFLPADGSLADLLDGPVDGLWQLLATDLGPGDPLCVFDWSLEIDHLTHSQGDVLPLAAGPFTELREVSLGTRHGLARGCDGSLWGWGENLYGEVGIAGGGEVLQPVQIPGVNLGIPSPLAPGGTLNEMSGGLLATGSEHSLALTQAGLFGPEVLTWGRGSAGQLGLGSFDDVSTPSAVALPLIASLYPVVQVGAGDLHSLALLENGQVLGWGDNHSAQLSVSGLYNILSPIELPLLLPADFFLVGLPPQTGSFGQIEAGGLFNLGIQSAELCVGGGGGGIPNGDDDDIPGPQEFHGDPHGDDDDDDFGDVGICQLLQGLFPLHELGEAGAVWGWGDDSHGQMGQGDVNVHVGLGLVMIDTLPPNVVLSAGYDHALALDYLGGDVWSWGNNDEGQLGRPTLATSEQATPTIVAGLPAVTAIAAGAKFSIAVDEYGRLWGWGRNDAGQLADGTGLSIAVPQLLDLGQDFACSLFVQAGFDSVVARDCGSLCGEEPGFGVPTPAGNTGDPLSPPPPPTPPPGYDVDSDGDLLSDLIEGGLLSTATDTDGGGVPDFQDPDSDNDGILDCLEAGDRYIATPAVDSDGDGVPDFRDLDSDNDGIPDGVEGTADLDGDGLPNFIDTDSDGDGIPDSAEGSGDLDGDGIPDHLDLDVDGDGIANAVEGTADPDGDGNGNEIDLDSDGDGIPDQIEGLADSDADGVFDYIDLDSDGDGIPDSEESGYDSNGDGTVETEENRGDLDSDADGIANFRDTDSDNDGLLDSVEGIIDSDMDGSPNFLDLDSDGDGILDAVEGDGDGDQDGVGNFLDLDSDGDGILDAVEGEGDKDRDGLANFLDLDSDNDGIDDAVAGAGDLDGNGLLNFVDPDADGDLIVNQDEGVADSDGDGIPNFLDTDSDGDGIPDRFEGPGDLDGDGIPNYLDDDSDGDGIPDSVYGIDGNGNPIPYDLDNDGIPNHLDPDADGDGILNADEGLVDFDGDGLPNALDFDADGDGIPDAIEGTADVDGDGEEDYLDVDLSNGPDSDPDDDGLRSETELLYGLDPHNPDSDFDGIPDGLEFGQTSTARDEGEPVDTDLDGVIDALDEDSDGDGWPDAAEAPLDPSNPPDSDGDGIYDFRDLDSDNDGLSDAEELAAGTSPVNADSDGDGVSDGDEVANGSDPMSGTIPAQLVAGEGGCLSSLAGGRPRVALGLLAVLLGLLRLVSLRGQGRRRRPRVSILCLLLLLGACEPEPDADFEPPDMLPSAPQLSLPDDLEVAEGALVTLEARAVDIDGDIESWQWQQLSGDPIDLMGATTSRAIFMAPSTVTILDLLFSVTVVDTQALSAVGELSVRVLPINAAPQVHAGPDQWVDEGDTVSLVGEALDPDGTIADSSWSVVAGTGIELVAGEGNSASFEAPGGNNLPLILELRVSDDEGAVGSDQLQVAVRPAEELVPDNVPPEVDAGGSQEVSEGTPVSLSASASDSDGTIVSLLWSQQIGPGVELAGENTETLEFDAPFVGADTLLAFEVVVTDDAGASHSDQVTVLVLDINQGPQVEAGPPQTVQGGDTVTLTGLASDPDGGLTATVWSQLSGTSVSLSTPSSTSTTFLAPSLTVGEVLSFRLMVQDDAGLTAHDDVEVEVLATNQPPTVDAGVDQSVVDGDVVQLSGSAVDSDGSVVSLSWLQLTGETVVLSTPTSSSSEFAASSFATEVLTFAFSATDDDGAKTSDTVRITVEVPPPPPGDDLCCSTIPGVGGPGTASICYDLGAFACVASLDPFCTSNEWDSTCVGLYLDTCGPVSTCAAAPPPASDLCCSTSPGVGGPGSSSICEDTTTFNCVAADDLFCVFTDWGANCVDAYLGLTGSCGPASTCLVTPTNPCDPSPADLLCDSSTGRSVGSGDWQAQVLSLPLMDCGGGNWSPGIQTLNVDPSLASLYLGGVATPPATVVFDWVVTEDGTVLVDSLGPSPYNEFGGPSRPFLSDAPVAGLVFPQSPSTSLQAGCLKVLPIVEATTGGRLDLLLTSSTLQNQGDNIHLDVGVVSGSGLDLNDSTDLQDLENGLIAAADIFYNGSGQLTDFGTWNFFEVEDPSFANIPSSGAAIETLRAVPLGSDPRSIKVFIIAAFDGGTLGIAGGIPGPLGHQDLPASAVVIAADSLFLFSGGLDVDYFSTTLAHEIGHQVGLFHSSEASGTSWDPLADTPECSDPNGITVQNCPDGDNLMFWSGGPGDVQTTLSQEQANVINNTPIKR